MTTESRRARTNGIATHLAVAAVFTSLAGIPIVVGWVGAAGWHTESGAAMAAFGIVVMLPGVLLGATSLLVMLGGGS